MNSNIRSVKSFENNVLTMTNQNPMGHNRAVMDFSKDGKYYFKMEVSPDGKQWQTFMEGSYNRE